MLGMSDHLESAVLMWYAMDKSPYIDDYHILLKVNYYRSQDKGEKVPSHMLARIQQHNPEGHVTGLWAERAHNHYALLS